MPGPKLARSIAPAVAMLRILCSFLFVSIPAMAGAETCRADLESVLAGYVEARGGHAAIERQRALRLVSTNHEGKWNPRFDYRVLKPGYMWIEAMYDDGEIIVEGFDGERGWEKWGDKPAAYVSGQAGRALNQGAMSPVHLYGLHHMSGLGADVTFTGCLKIGGESYFVVKVVSAFGTDIDYLINVNNYQLERSRTVRALHPTVDPTEVTIEERWSDFREVNGILHPFRLELWNIDAGERLSWLEVHSIERLTDVTAEFFARPD